jgi:hypothetical protein
MTVKSKDCSLGCGKMAHIFKHDILEKYDVDYFQCPICHLIQTEKPYWLNEAYESAITKKDTGLATRNIKNRDRLEAVIYNHFVKDSTIIDIGGGYGLLTRLMRDIGFDFLTYDIYCENIFAKNFEATNTTRSDLLTAFEVFEHIENPLEFLEDEFSRHQCKNIIFSTLPYHTEHYPSLDWWYYTFDTGQHISFYHPKSLVKLTSTFNCHYYQLDQDLHMICEQKLDSVSELLITHKKLAKIYRKYVRKKRKKMSLTLSDAGF